MAYKVAVATSDGIHVDLSFGSAPSFLIYEVDNNLQIHLQETRVYEEIDKQEDGSLDCKNVPEGCHGGHGCGGHQKSAPKIRLVEDCRCVLCKKIGFQAQKQLEKKAITAFAVEYEIVAALGRIISYFDRVDHHRSLCGIAK